MKTILLTGGTDGIGKLTAVKLAGEGHKVLVHGRDRQKLKNTVSEIQNSTENKAIIGHICDLSDFNNVRVLIKQLSEEYPKIDVIINNAGVFKSHISKNKDNLDIRFAVNYFAPYLLTNGLFPLLAKSNSPRIINLSSAAQSTVSIEALAGKEPLSASDAYAQSKLDLTMRSFYLAKKLTHLNVIAVNPGSLLDTKMVHEAYGQYWSSAEKGANIVFDLAVLTKYDKSSGKYFDNDIGDFSHAHKDAYDTEKIDRLVSETDRIIGA